MTSLLKFTFMTSVVLQTTTPAFSADQSGTSNAEIRRLISVAETAQLNFGQISIDTISGIVTLSPTGSMSSNNTNYVFKGEKTPAEFTVNGDNNSLVSISFSTGNKLTDQLGRGGVDMPLSNFTHDAGTSPTFTNGTLVFRVGADLNVSSNQQTSVYQGQYTITVDYQ